MQIHRTHAFSLVELSIVLVILGLLVGGVLSGQSLIHAAELRSVASDYTKYAAGIQSFRDKYFAIPGDMLNATSFWGKDTARCNAQPGAAGTPGTCNGDGDGVVAWYVYGLFEQTPWQHLALAGLLEGKYSGVQGYVAGVDMPASKIGSGAMWDFGGIQENWWGGSDEFINYAILTNNSSYATGVLKAEDAWNIDSKLDDGRPLLGKVRAVITGGTCWDIPSTPATANYLLTNTSPGCTLAFRAL